VSPSVTGVGLYSSQPDHPALQASQPSATGARSGTAHAHRADGDRHAPGYNTQPPISAQVPRSSPRSTSTRMATLQESTGPKSNAQPAGTAQPPRPATSPSGPQKSTSTPDSKRPNILVVERSLDEVILSYLQDDLSEK
jgi:hypothetical protein